MVRELRVRLGVFLDGARRKGLVSTLLGRLFETGVAFTIWVVCLPATFLLHMAGYRRLTVITSRIGHLAAELDCFLKALALGELPARRWFALAPSNRIANAHLLSYWQAKLPIVTGSIACFLLGAMSRWLLLRYDVSHYVLALNATQDIYRINALWNGRPPQLKLNSEDACWSESVLRELGLPHGAWFVCVHVREAGFSPIDESAHAHRNGNPRATLLAVSEIVRRGGWCIRMGDPSMSPLTGIPGLIDYAHHRLRSSRLDVVLCARARFFLGNSSGLALVSTVFGVPCVLANMIPMSALAPLASDISIPKMIWHDRDSRLLRFDEILGSPAGDFRYAHLYSEAGVTVVENSPEELLEVTTEMLDRLEGTHAESNEDKQLQERFFSYLQRGHYSYGAVSRVGGAFLRRYRELLLPTAVR